MAGIVVKREPTETVVKREPVKAVLLAATAHPKLEVGIDEDCDQSDDEPILMSVKLEMLEQDEVCVCAFLDS